MLSTTDIRAALCLAILSLGPANVHAQTENAGRVAIGMLQANQLPSVAVEITTDGWVRLDLIATRVDGGVQAPSMRLLVEPRDVRIWATRVRGMLKTLRDSGGLKTPPEQHLLGNGNYQLNVTRKWGEPSDGGCISPGVRVDRVGAA